MRKSLAILVFCSSSSWGAIALDVVSSTGVMVQVSSLTWSHTCTGSNLILMVGVGARSTVLTDDTVTGITYAGSQNFTKVVSTDVSTGNRRSEVWQLTTPNTGAHNIVVSFQTNSSNQNAFAWAASFTGAAQSGQVDAKGANVGSTVTSVSTNVFTVANNDWIFDVLMIGSGATGVTAGGTQVQKVNKTGGGNAQLLGSVNGPITPPSNKADSWSWTNTTNTAIAAAAIIPFVAAGGAVVCGPPFSCVIGNP